MRKSHKGTALTLSLSYSLFFYLSVYLSFGSSFSFLSFFILILWPLQSSSSFLKEKEMKKKRKRRDTLAESKGHHTCTSLFQISLWTHSTFSRIAENKMFPSKNIICIIFELQRVLLDTYVINYALYSHRYVYFFFFRYILSFLFLCLYYSLFFSLVFLSRLMNKS